MADTAEAAKQAFFAAMGGITPYRQQVLACIKLFGDAEKQAEAAIAARNAALLKGIGEQLKGIAKDAKAADGLHPGVVKGMDAALAFPANVEKHGASMAGWRDQVALLKRENDKLLGKVTALAKKLRTLRAQLDEARDEARRLLGDAEVLLDADGARATEAREALQQAWEQGLAAQRGRDAAALAAAQKAGKEVPLRALQEALRSIDAELARIKAESLDGKSLGAGVLGKAKTDWKRLSERRDAMAAALDACPPLLQRLAALALDTIDVRRAAAHLDLDRDAHAELSRALQGDDGQMQRNLEQLARRRKLQGSGRELLSRLRKAQVL